MHPKTVVVLIVCHNGRAFLHECLTSVLASTDEGIDRRIVVVDNGSTDGCADALESVWPEVLMVRSCRNLGFSGGNNLGWEHARRSFPTAEYLCLLNQDTVVENGWLKALVGHLDRHSHVGIAQAKLKTPAQLCLIDPVGRGHFLGFCFLQGSRKAGDGIADAPRIIDFAIGAALLVRASLLEEVGLFDDAMFMYLEDADLAWKSRQIGIEVHYVPHAVVFHKYTTGAPLRHFEYLARNRWLLLLTYYKLPTLLLLAPALALAECGQVVFAVRRGLFFAYLRAWRGLLSRSAIANLLQRRRVAQSRRTAGDRFFLGGFTGELESPVVQSWLLRRIGNPLFRVYWSLAKRLIFW